MLGRIVRPSTQHRGQREQGSIHKQSSLAGISIGGWGAGGKLVPEAEERKTEQEGNGKSCMESWKVDVRGAK